MQSVSGIVEKKHTLPILSNVLLEKTGDRLTLLATDIEIKITTTTEAIGGEGDAAVTVGARKLQDILRSLPDTAEVAVTFDDKRLLVQGRQEPVPRCRRAAGRGLSGMTLAEGEQKSLTVTQKQFRQLLGKTQFAMATQDVRYYLNGLLLLVEGNELRAVATDGHRLAYASMPLDGEGLPARHELILPRKTVLELSRLLAGNDDALVVELAPNKCASSSVTSRWSQADRRQVPRLRARHSAVAQDIVALNRATLLQSMVRAAILTNEKFRGVRLVLGDGSMKIMAANSEQEEAQEELEVDYAGDPIDVSFNVGYLLDVLNNSSSELIEWGFNDANSSALLTIPATTSSSMSSCRCAFKESL